MSDFSELFALESFGFSRHQARVFRELTALGPTTAGPLVKRVRLHRQFVYSALDELEEQGFVSHVIKNGRKVFSAARPETLLDRATERMRAIQLAVPILQKLSPKGDDPLHIEVQHGRDEFIRRLYTLLDSAARCDGIMRGIAAVRDVDVYAIIGEAYQDYVNYTKKLKVKKRIIAPATSASKGYQERLSREKGAELRVLPTGISIPTSTFITPELVILDIFGSDVVSIMIWNRTIAKGFMDHFAVLWNSAKKFKA